MRRLAAAAGLLTAAAAALPAAAQAQAPALQLKVPGVAYAGYPVEVRATATGLAEFVDVVVTRRGAARPAATIRMRERGDGVLTLPAGAQTLQASATLTDGSVVTSPPLTVPVRRGGRRTTGPLDDGAYVRAGNGPPLTFRVVDDGRELRRAKTTLTAFCVGPTIGSNRVIVATYFIPRARVAPNGSVLTKTKIGETTLELRGRLRNRRLVDGEARIRFSTCSGTDELAARRSP